MGKPLSLLTQNVTKPKQNKASKLRINAIIQNSKYWESNTRSVNLCDEKDGKQTSMKRALDAVQENEMETARKSHKSRPNKPHKDDKSMTTTKKPHSININNDHLYWQSPKISKH